MEPESWILDEDFNGYWIKISLVNKDKYFTWLRQYKNYLDFSKIELLPSYIIPIDHPCDYIFTGTMEDRLEEDRSDE